MFANQRRSEILHRVQEQKTVSVNELSEKLNVSAATVRADLNSMEKQGLLTRTHGGAMMKEKDDIDKKYAVREKKHRSEKQRIAAAAFEYIEDDQCIILDASTTCFELAKFIKESTKRLTIVTSGLTTATMLKENPNLTVIIIGGIVRSGSNSIEGLIGHELLKKVNVDILFTSAYALNASDGLTDFSLYEVELKREMVATARKTIALVDNSKIDKSSIATFAKIEDIELLVTDQALSPDLAAYFSATKVPIDIAN
ncbi:DeoR/GlpR family DNA-binding transcription regulator [Listeria cornellensis]|uniref:DeoR family transcriptional regulator n=1 Tax=Listeria cornellensis FSL F6-0969 TaxID=1265820 RepID=W7BML7_9LIST|nr:DeoR/GlpR family DNA-binding transcription regulator [Listeria cornellensis]EUJ28189.1 DeoR family transcriptional regulator [Listeria cornellensis FSL F6-0969]